MNHSTSARKSYDTDDTLSIKNTKNMPFMLEGLESRQPGRMEQSRNASWLEDWTPKSSSPKITLVLEKRASNNLYPVQAGQEAQNLTNICGE